MGRQGPSLESLAHSRYYRTRSQRDGWPHASTGRQERSQEQHTPVAPADAATAAPADGAHGHREPGTAPCACTRAQYAIDASPSASDSSEGSVSTPRSTPGVEGGLPLRAMGSRTMARRALTWLAGFGSRFSVLDVVSYALYVFVDTQRQMFEYADWRVHGAEAMYKYCYLAWTAFTASIWRTP